VVATSVVQFDNFTIQSWIDAMRRAADFHGIELIMLDGQNNATLQANQYESFVAQKVDLILIDPVDAKAIVPVVKKINKAGIPAINFDAPAEGGNFVALVSMDWLMAGILSGVQIINATGGKGNVVMVEGTPGFAAQYLRTNGVELVLSAYPDIKIVAKKAGMFSRAGGLRATEQLLREQPKVDAWYFQNDDMFLGGIKAIKAAGRREGTKILSVDGNPEALNAMLVGDLDYEVVGGFNLQGWLVIETAAKVLMGEKVPEKVGVPLTWAPPLRRLDTAHAVTWGVGKELDSDTQNPMRTAATSSASSAGATHTRAGIDRGKGGRRRSAASK
jgi:ABC-type sugar transport system substrate-binding protein